MFTFKHEMPSFEFNSISNTMMLSILFLTYLITYEITQGTPTEMIKLLVALLFLEALGKDPFFKENNFKGKRI